MTKYASQIIPEASGIGDLIDAINDISTKSFERNEERYISNLENIRRAGVSSLTQEQITNAQQALNSISGDSSLSGTTRIAYDTVKANLNNQQFEIDKYTTSIQQGAEIINSPNFLDEAEDWRNLEDLRKSKTNEDGTYTYESVGSMLAEEYVAIESLYKNINNKNFRYNKDATFDDQEVVNKINIYKDRLDKAIMADLGDGIITIDEAQLIMRGINKSEFNTQINNKKTELKDLITDKQSLIETINGKIAGNVDNEQMIALMEKLGGLENLNPEEQAAFLSNDPKALEDMLKTEQADLDTLYTQWQYWSGSGYGQKTPQKDSSELVKIAGEDEEVINLEAPDFGVSDWSDTAYTKKEIEEPERPDVPIEGEDVLLEDEDITLKGDEPLKDYKFDVEKPKTPTVPIEGEDELFEEDITLKGDQPLEDYKLSTKEKTPTPSEVIDEAEKEYKTKQEIREAEYYSILPEADFDIKITPIGNVRGDKKNKAKVDNIYQNIKQMGIEDIEKNIEQLYENFLKGRYRRGDFKSDEDFDRKNESYKRAHMWDQMWEHKKILKKMQWLLKKIEKGGSTFSNIDSLKAKLVKKYNQLMKSVENDTKEGFMKSKKTIKPSDIGYKKWLEENPDATIFERE